MRYRGLNVCVVLECVAMYNVFVCMLTEKKECSI